MGEPQGRRRVVVLLSISGTCLRALDMLKLPPHPPVPFAKFSFELESVFPGKCNPYVSDSLTLYL